MLQLSCSAVSFLHYLVCGCNRPDTLFSRCLWCRGFFGKSVTVGDHDVHDPPSEQPTSRADLAAAGELNSLAEVRGTEAEEDDEDGGNVEHELHPQPFRQGFGVTFSRLSGRLPSVTHHLPRFARSSRDKDSVGNSSEGSLLPK